MYYWYVATIFSYPTRENTVMTLRSVNTRVGFGPVKKQFWTDSGQNPLKSGRNLNETLP